MLADVVKKYKAEKACAVVIDPDTGEVLAMGNTPVFDTNEFGKVEEKDRRNVVITDQYEPGSTFKVVVAAAALEAGLVTPSTTFSLGREIRVYDRVVHEAHDDLPPRGNYLYSGSAQSSNVGAVSSACPGQGAVGDMIPTSLHGQARSGFPRWAWVACSFQRNGRAQPLPNIPIGRDILQPAAASSRLRRHSERRSSRSLTSSSDEATASIDE